MKHEKYRVYQVHRFSLQIKSDFRKTGISRSRIQFPREFQKL